MEDLQFALSDTLAQLVINHEKPGRRINTGSEITKLAPLQSKIPQPELPQLELLQSEPPQPASPQALPTVEGLLKFPNCLKDNDLKELTDKLLHQLTFADN